MREKKEDRLEKIRREQIREAALSQARTQRDAKLSDDVDRLLMDFSTGDPSQIGYLLADMEATGQITAKEKEVAYFRLATKAGLRFADEAMGLASRRQPELASTWSRLRSGRYPQPLELPDTVVDQVAQRAELTTQLVRQFAESLGFGENGVIVRADEEARRRTQERRAHGLMDRGTVYLNPDAYDPASPEGKRLLGHELVHVAQRNLGGTRATIPAAEHEAANLANAFAAGQPLGAPTVGLPAMHAAADTDASLTNPQQGAQAPSSINLSLGGHSFTVQLPANTTQPQIDVQFNEEPVTGLRLTGASLQFDDRWAVTGGTVRGAVNIGGIVTCENVSLSVSQGGEITADIQGANLNVEGRLNGTIDLTVSTEGIAGQADLTHSQVTIEPGFTMTGGTLAVALGTTGNLSANGTLNFSVEGIGTASLEAAYQDGEFSGTITVNVTEQQNLIPNVILQSGTLTGQYSRSGCTVSGNATISIPGVATGEFQATYQHPQRQISGQANLHQDGELTMGGLVMSRGEFSATVQSNQLTQVSASAHLRYDRFEGDLQGTYDVPGHSLSGQANFNLTEDVPLGNVTLMQDGTQLTGQVQANAVTGIGGTAHLKVNDDQGELVDVRAVAEYKVQEGLVSGQGTATLSRNLEFGAETAKIIIDQGATAVAIVQNNQLVSVTGSLTAHLNDAQGELANGNLSGEYKAAEKQFSGTGTVNLSRDVNLTEDPSGKLVLRQGATVTATVENNQVKTLTGECELSYERQGQEIVKGTLSGTYQFQEKQFDGSGSATLVNDLEFPTESGGKVVLLKDSAVTATVAKSVLTDLQLTQVGFRYDDAQGELCNGTVAGSYKSEGEAVNGSATVTLSRDVPLGQNPDSQFIIKQGATGTIEVANSQAKQMTAQANFTYNDAEGELVNGNANGTYTFTDQKFTGSGSATLTRDLTINPEGSYKLSLLKDSTVTASVTNNELDKISGTINFRLDDPEQAELVRGTATGEYVGAQKSFSGSITGTLSKDLVKQAGESGELKLLTGSTVTATVSNNALDTITGDLTGTYGDEKGELLRGTLNGTYKLEPGEFTGTGTMTLQRDVEKGNSFGTIRVLQGAQATAQITANKLEKVSGTLSAVFLDDKGELLKGDINGDLYVEPGEFTGSGTVTLVRDVELGEGSYKLTLVKNSQVTANVDRNKFVDASGTLDVKIDDEQGTFVTGQINGQYKVAENNFSGTGQAQLVRDVSIPVGDKTLMLLKGSSGNGAVTDNKLTQLEGTLNLKVTDAQGDLITGSLSGKYDPSVQKFDGSGQAQLARDLELPVGDKTLTFLKDSGGTATVQQNELKQIQGSLNFKLSDGEGELLKGSANGTYDAPTTKFSGAGQAELARDISLEVGDGKTLKFLKGSSAAATIADNELKQIDGTLNLKLTDAEGDLLSGGVTGKYVVNPGEFTGSGSMTLERDIEKSNEFGTIRVIKGSHATAQITANKLEKVNGTLTAVFLDSEGELLKGDVTGDLYIEQGEFTGSGTVTLMRDISFGEGGYTVTIIKNSQLTANVDRNKFVDASGTLDIKIDDDQGTFVTGQIAGTYKMGTSTFSGTGHAELARDVAIPIGDKTLTVLKGSGGTGAIADNKLTQLEGTLNLKLADGQGDLITGSLTGKYDATSQKFDGSGQAQLARDISITFGSKTLTFLKGSGGTATLQQNELKQIQGTLNLKLTDAEGDLITGSITGTYDAQAGKFSGSGQAKLARDIKLELGGGKTLKFLKGSSGSATITDNELKQLDGTINILLTDAEGDLLTGGITGQYVVDTGKFSGTGQAQLARDIKMPLGDKTLYFLKGSGGSATIADNELKQIQGTLNLKLTDEKGDLITGALNGTYDAVKSEFAGSGEAHLARDVEIELGTGKIVIKSGSGGGAEIANNALERVWGTLNAELHDKDGLLMTGSLNGEYKVREGKFSGTGTASLTREMQLAGGNVIISNVTGTATVTDNKLTSAGGSASIRIPPLNNMTGTFNINWRNDGGRDIYSGSGKINFTLNERISGEVDMEYKEDDTWKVHGEVELKITEQLKGKIGVEVDQNLDPIMSGTLSIENVDLVPARDLFGLKFDILPAQDIPLGIPGLNLHIGVGAGLGATFQGLKLNASIEVSDFHPLKVNVPNFRAHAELPTGLNFFAEVKPAIGITGGVTGLNVGIALEGGVRLNVPISITPYADLIGENGKFRGELGIGLCIAPNVTLSAHPYIFATIGREFRYDGLPTWSYTFPDLFKWEWSGKYKWGEQGPEGKEAGAVTQTETPQAQPVAGVQQNNTNQAVDVPAKNGSGASPGGPDIGGGDQLAGEAGKGQSPLDGLMEKIDQIKEWADKIAKVAYAFSEVMNVISVASMGAMFGPLGLLAVPVYLAYRYWIAGDLDFGKIADGFRVIFDLIGQGLDMLREYLPDWFSKVWEYVQKGAGALKELLSQVGDWILQNLKALGQATIDFLKGVGEWGANIIKGAGEWAVQAAGWVWDQISNAAEEAWDFVTSW